MPCLFGLLALSVQHTEIFMSSFEDSFGSDHLFLVVFIVWEKLRQSGWRLDKSVLSALPRVLLGSHTHARVGWGRQHHQAPGSFEHCPELNVVKHCSTLKHSPKSKHCSKLKHHPTSKHFSKLKHCPLSKHCSAIKASKHCSTLKHCPKSKHYSKLKACPLSKHCS